RSWTNRVSCSQKGILMNRACFLCSGETETIRSATWSLPHLDAQPIAFGLCTTCGLALQTRSVSPEEMTRYYTESAVYTNPGRAGRPTAGKVRGVDRALSQVRDSLGRMPKSVFQVGSSDGYTLSRFQSAGCESVGGVEPSLASCQMARECYGVETIVGTVEDIELPTGVEMWVLTHVLEHLYDPLAVLKNIREAQASGAWVLVEVPLLEQPERFPPSYLTFEHLNYFAESSMVHMLTRAGYEVEQIEKNYSDDLYPVIRVLARASERKLGKGMPHWGEIDTTRLTLRKHIGREACSWAQCEARVRAALPKGAPVWLWGAGIHSSQLLSQTDLEAYFDIQGLVDSSPIRHGQSFGEYGIFDPESIDFMQSGAIVISSHAAEQEIWDALESERLAGVTVVRLYSDEESLAQEELVPQEAA
ncbi:MAG: class I SAM-dependent methyltransferase, partial [Gammaproteobacteria bacterium]|nr:class I SAM-dependent methyltransferase [Gammaproteobacteria bacterium]